MASFTVSARDIVLQVALRLEMFPAVFRNRSINFRMNLEVRALEIMISPKLLVVLPAFVVVASVV